MPGIDAQEWRRRAAKARAEADQMRNVDAKRALLEAAATCERVAQAAETAQPRRRRPGTLRALGTVVLAGSLTAPTEWVKLIPLGV